MQLKIFTAFILFGVISPLKIEKDHKTVPLLYAHDREIEYEVSKIQYSYQINMNIITDLRSEHLLFSQTCGSSPHYQIFYENLFDMNIWDWKKDEKAPEDNLIELEPYSLQALKSDYYFFKYEQDIEKKCIILQAMAKQIRNFDNELRKIHSSILSSISNIIPMEKLLNHTHHFTTATNLTNALDLNQWFTQNPYKYSEIKLKFNNNYAYLTMSIPLFKHSKISKIFPKPVILNNVPYILTTQSEYIIEDQIGINYISNLNENCFYVNYRVFCRKLKYENDCDKQYVAQSSIQFNSKCFTKLPIRNTITQIKNNLFFLIFEPMILNVSCGGAHQIMRLTENSKILNVNCYINTTFFNYNPRSLVEYGIYHSNSNTSEWNIFQNPKHKMIIQYFCYAAFLTLYLIILGIIIYKTYAHKPSEDRLGTLV